MRDHYVDLLAARARGYRQYRPPNDQYVDLNSSVPPRVQVGRHVIRERNNWRTYRRHQRIGNRILRARAAVARAAQIQRELVNSRTWIPNIINVDDGIRFRMGYTNQLTPHGQARLRFYANRWRARARREE